MAAILLHLFNYLIADCLFFLSTNSCIKIARTEYKELLGNQFLNTSARMQLQIMQFMQINEIVHSLLVLIDPSLNCELIKMYEFIDASRISNNLS